jgi:hypothetical protein
MKNTVVLDPFDIKPRTHDVLKCLFYEPQWLDLLKNRNKPYEAILSNLQNLPQEHHYNNSAEASIKGLSATYGIKAITLTNWIHQIYSDLFELNNEFPMLFKSEGIQCELEFKDRRHCLSFTLWIKSVPRLNEQFYFGFLQARTNFSLYHVEEITHYYTTQDQHFLINLNQTAPNIYRRFLGDKAIFNGLIPHYEPSLLNVDLLDKKLKELARRMS